MALKVAINGFGRIGRCVARIISSRDDVELVCVNDTASREMTEQLLKYDSVHGTFDGVVKTLEDGYMQIGNSRVKMFSTRDPKELNFSDYGVDVVLECTGAFLTKEKAQVFIDNGVKKVLMSAPAKDDTPTFVIGVNEDKYAGEAIVSNASCTTNCLGPIAKVLDDAFGIDKGLMTTIHAYTNDQNILDVKHSKDLRRARAAAVNMIPTTTGAAKAIGLVLPQLKGRLHGQSVRVPTPNVSMVDLNVLVKKDTTIAEVNALLKEKAENELAGIVLIDEEYRVSQDFQSSSYSSVVASDLTQVIAGNMIKVMAWYDNEWGYSTRLIDMALHISK
ncbi:MAG TPA: type I glyceraldehyde-3-phosphate dehydrogenase [Sulfurospirillum sp. UBA12182]|jgi:glyceraldehyde 3-phosphate dehydrogenase|nr:MAG TPA: type I glyceraldehyde-3-phosphate dehydrogenase [Sulfurospirillum sp. UBA12182]